jgi:hypothetical protein
LDGPPDSRVNCVWRVRQHDAPSYGLRAYLVSLDQNHLPLNIQFLSTSNSPANIRTVRRGDNDFNEQLPMHGITKAVLVKAPTPPRG